MVSNLFTMKAKRGRPRVRKASELADVFVSFRITGKELKSLEDVAERCGMSRSTFIRRAMLDSVANINAKSRSKGRNFVDMCRFIVGKD